MPSASSDKKKGDGGRGDVAVGEGEEVSGDEEDERDVCNWRIVYSPKPLEYVSKPCLSPPSSASSVDTSNSSSSPLHSGGYEGVKEGTGQQIDESDPWSTFRGSSVPVLQSTADTLFWYFAEIDGLSLGEHMPMHTYTNTNS